MSTSQGCSIDELNLELEAMQTIARAIAAVRNPEVRLRILRWTNERFTGAPTGPSRRAHDAPQTLNPDPSLAWTDCTCSTMTMPGSRFTNPR